MTEEILEALGWSGEVLGALEWSGASGLVVGMVDGLEHERRERIGLGGVVDRRTIEAVASIGPEPVPCREVTELSELGATSGLVAWGRNDTVFALARPPVRVEGVIVTGHGWRETLSRASRFSLVAPRVAAVDRRPRDLDAAVAQAMWFDAGLVVTSDAAVDVLGHPGPTAGDDDAYRWWFGELVYSAHLQLSTAVRRHPSAA